ncbi:MAG: TolC family protein [bacterium]
MIKRSFKFILMFSFGISLYGQSLAAQSVKWLSLNACIEAALKNHPSLQAFKKMQESKAAAAKSLQAQAYPELEFIFQGSNYHYNDYRYRTFDNRLNLVWDMGKWQGKLKKIRICKRNNSQITIQAKST